MLVLSRDQNSLLAPEDVLATINCRRTKEITDSDLSAQSEKIHHLDDMQVPLETEQPPLRTVNIINLDGKNIIENLRLESNSSSQSVYDAFQKHIEEQPSTDAEQDLLAQYLLPSQELDTITFRRILTEDIALSGSFKSSLRTHVARRYLKFRILLEDVLLLETGGIILNESDSQPRDSLSLTLIVLPARSCEGLLSEAGRSLIRSAAIRGEWITVIHVLAIGEEPGVLTRDIEEACVLRRELLMLLPGWREAGSVFENRSIQMTNYATSLSHNMPDLELDSVILDTLGAKRIGSSFEAKDIPIWESYRCFAVAFQKQSIFQNTLCSAINHKLEWMNCGNPITDVQFEEFKRLIQETLNISNLNASAPLHKAIEESLGD